ncbi:unnamed protein product [Arabidopsis lyrata]|uniref:Cotton fiber protein n=1 Tax=Arabidopsis lyrata subsp. lyrata TaxID=81972 RepID=D7MNA6_ARALL|nr:uncharacterized protein LOC9302284 [Arabidopsis lyrata subsp. lyrata]XP_020868208.1 uncharacterized protein LOC110224880 [Arabidopsis lyrata subsp. lyrata]EFH42469.1 hypothetical protein ARALYDRAFT_918928 [Arabidopsis lyrata subsp. lyrata]CAH8280003.1 unnamed protein product [Arabidopsis lyrata]|eukprot:XP_002866210.1 uncharacterized protein LOC9302284 [Arabidopsis lyrata subsp. lyrata]
MAKSKDRSLLNRLRQAVNKVRFVLSFKINSLWDLVPMLGSSSSSSSLRLSFNDRPGLTAAFAENEPDLNGSSRGALYRTVSYDQSSDEDIDNKAEMFIANFYRQLKIERQISLELKYFQGNNQSFNYRSP